MDYPYPIDDIKKMATNFFTNSVARKLKPESCIVFAEPKLQRYDAPVLTRPAPNLVFT
jgi:hypothetical protein